jgi:Fe2+ transport system protein FeoA
MPERNGKALPRIPELQRIADLPAGSVVRLSCQELSQGEACLLAAMGMTEGCRLTVRTSGDPCIVEVRSTRIGLARSVAARLVVASEAPSASTGPAVTAPPAATSAKG